MNIRKLNEELKKLLDEEDKYCYDPDIEDVIGIKVYYDAGEDGIYTIQNQKESGYYAKWIGKNINDRTLEFDAKQIRAYSGKHGEINWKEKTAAKEKAERTDFIESVGELKQYVNSLFKYPIETYNKCLEELDAESGIYYELGFNNQRPQFEYIDIQTNAFINNHDNDLEDILKSEAHKKAFLKLINDIYDNVYENISDANCTGRISPYDSIRVYLNGYDYSNLPNLYSYIEQQDII